MDRMIATTTEIELRSLRRACLEAIRRGFGGQTTTRGTCVYVSLTVRGIYGGELLRSTIGNRVRRSCLPHFWNRLPVGEEVDLTSDQFGGDGFTPLLTNGKPAPVPSPLPIHYLLFIREVGIILGVD